MDVSFCYLSHLIGDRVPAYGDPEAGVGITSVKSLQRGDSCDVFRFCMENHWGTHLDAPAHFYPGARRVSDYTPEELVFKRPQILELVCGKETIVTPSMLEGRVAERADLLLLKTGFQRYRGTETYSLRGPGVAAETGFWLRRRFPSLRAVGFDFISLSSYAHREEGRRAHRAFLDPKGVGRPILIIEDMDLSADLRELSQVWVGPLRLEPLDSAPCTVIGVLDGTRQDQG